MTSFSGKCPDSRYRLTEYGPDSGPLYSNSSHVVVRNFDNFLQRKLPRMWWIA